MITNQVGNPTIKKGHGGRRPGAGRPKGSVTPETIKRREVEATLKEMAGQHTATALQTLVEIMNDDTTPPAARVSAVKELLDRAHGKAPQAIVGDPDLPLDIRVSRIELTAPAICASGDDDGED